jgi:4-hydroxy-3-methylbut-2-enyl diphosphate reductase
MNVTIDPHSGFCFGVTRAVEVAERELENTGQLYCLGDIVHNAQEVDRLKSQGFEIISHKDLESLQEGRVMIRAHGEPPETYRMAKSGNNVVIDASCPIVLKLQKTIHKGYLEMEQRCGQVVIFGKAGHAEVNGLVGQTNGAAVVIGTVSDLLQIDFQRPVRLYSQTTMAPDDFEKIATLIRDRMERETGGPNVDFVAHDTICRQVSGRAAQLRNFAADSDVIIFVSGKKSSNGMVLYEVCRSVNPRSFLVAGPGELQKEWFEGVSSAGVCGATSTPGWLLQAVAGEMIKITD